MPNVRVTVNRAALKKSLNDPSGRFQKFIDEKAAEVERRAKANIPRFEGELAASGRITTITGRGGIAGRRIEFDAPHAAAHHDGTGPAHQTEGRPDPNASYYPAASDSLVRWAQQNVPHLLKFSSLGNPNLFIVQKFINQNGTAANPFLLDALKTVFPNAQGRFSK